MAPTYTITGQQSCCSEESYCCSLNNVCVFVCVLDVIALCLDTCLSCLFWLKNLRKTEVNRTFPLFRLVAFFLGPKCERTRCAVDQVTQEYTPSTQMLPTLPVPSVSPSVLPGSPSLSACQPASPPSTTTPRRS